MGCQSRENPSRLAQEQARQICSATERFESALRQCNYILNLRKTPLFPKTIATEPPPRAMPRHLTGLSTFSPQRVENWFASRYTLELPTKEELRRLLLEWRSKNEKDNWTS